MEIRALSGGSGRALGAVLLRESNRRNRRLSILELHARAYYAYGLGLARLDKSLTGFEKLKYLAFGPIFESLLQESARFGNDTISFEDFYQSGQFDVGIYDHEPGALQLIREALSIKGTATRLWNDNHSSPRSPYRIVQKELGNHAPYVPEIPPELVKDSFLEKLKKNSTI